MQRPIAASLALVLSACGAGAAPDPLADVCLVSTAGFPVRDSITVALPGTPVAGSSLAARFLAAQFGLDSTATDCEGGRLAHGLGAFRLVANDSLLIPADPRHSAPVIRLRQFPSGDDPRDWIDRGADVVLSADPPTLEYAGKRPELRLVRLAWSTVYVLVAPSGSQPVEPTALLRSELARDAVRAEARPAESGYWWEGNQRCSAAPPGPQARAPGIAISSQDPVARALAERLVALAPVSGLRRLSSYSSSGLDSLLASGAVAAAIVALPRAAPAECGSLTRGPEGWTLTPLIETRATAVVRSGVPPFLITGDGTLRFLSRPAP